MKRTKIIFTCALIYTMSAFVSCTTDETSSTPQNNVVIENSKALQELSNFNKELENKSPQTRSNKDIRKFLYVASADIFGAWTGGQVGARIGLKVGTLLGSPAQGTVAGAMVGAIGWGSYKSYKAYHKHDCAIYATNTIDPIFYQCMPNADKHISITENTIPNTENTTPNIENTIPNIDSIIQNSHLTIPNTENTTPNIENTIPNIDPITQNSHLINPYITEEKLKQLHLTPQEISIGVSHNELLRKLRKINSSAKSTTRTSIHSTELANFNIPYSEYIDSEELYKKALEEEKANLILTDNKANIAIHLFKEAFEKYSINEDNLIVIINKYSDIIRNSKEFTEEEKNAIMYGLSTAIHSYNYWKTEYIK